MYAVDPCPDGCSVEPVDPEEGAPAGWRCRVCAREHRGRERIGALRVAFWNKRNLVGPDKMLRVLERAAPRWDVMLLVECQARDVERLAGEYGVAQVASVFDHDVDRTRQKPHGPAVVVRHGLQVVSHRLTIDWDRDIPTEPKGDKSVTVEVEAPFGACTFIAAHVMNGGDGHLGWERKLRTYERLDAELGPEVQPWPVVVGMDGNVWEDHLDVDPVADHSQHAQAWFQAGHAAHGLRDTLRTAVLADPERSRQARGRLGHFDGIVGTFQLSARVTRFDRIYASPDTQVLDAGVDPVGLEVSDHAVVWADLLFPPTTKTRDPHLSPTPRAKRRPLEVDDVVQAVLRSDRFGWNRRGYLARVALASVSEKGFADQRFIRAHYPGDPAPHRQWSGARTTTNRSWKSIGEGRFGDELVTFDRSTRRHRMDRDTAQIVVEVLGIADLVTQIDRPDLEAILAVRLQAEPGPEAR